MSTLTVFLVAVVAAMIAAAVIGLRRRKPGPAVTAVVGCALLLASLVGGVLLLPERKPPEPLPDALGVLPPRPNLPLPGRGFAVALATVVNGCANPVTVTLVANGTSEYWSDYLARNPKSGNWALPFVLVLPDDVTRVLRVGVANSPATITDPVSARVADVNPVQVHSIVSHPDQTVVTGTVSDWSSTFRPLLVTFQADWLTPRGLSTCYLRLPVLSGGLTATAAVGAVGCRHLNAAYPSRPAACRHTLVAPNGIPYNAALVLNAAESVVSVHSGEVSHDLSVPPPPSVISGEAAWTCHVPAAAPMRFPHNRVGLAAPNVAAGRGGDAYSLATIEASGINTCRAVAVISENSAAYSRDLLILIIGAVVGLAVTLVVQAGIEMLTPTETHEDGAAPPPSAT